MKKVFRIGYSRPDISCFDMRARDVITDSIDDWMWDDYEDAKYKEKIEAKKNKRKNGKSKSGSWLSQGNGNQNNNSGDFFGLFGGSNNDKNGKSGGGFFGF